MEDIEKQGQDRAVVRKELLGHLQKLEQDGWIIFGWHHMNLDKRRWLKNPQKLTECDYYQKVIKNWLGEERIVVPRKSSPDGLVRYEGLEGLDSSCPLAESIFFQLWLARGTEVCSVSYSEHKFNAKVFEGVLGRAGFAIVFFPDWLKIIPVLLDK